MPLSVEDKVGHVKRTWGLIRNGMGKWGTDVFFWQLFERNKGVDKMFSEMHDPGCPKYPVRTSKKLFDVVGAAVDLLPDLGTLVPILQQQARYCQSKGAQPAHFEPFGEALMITLTAGLQTAWTPEVAESWTWVWMTIVDVMTKEMNLYKDCRNATSVGGMIGDVTESWNAVATLGAEAVGVLLFKRIFEIAPQALQLFSFRREPDLYNSPKLKAHGKKVVETVGHAVAGLQTLDALWPILRNLGKAHSSKFNVEPAHYDVVGQALIDTLRLGLKEKFTPKVQDAWTNVFTIIKACMTGA